MKSLLLQNHPSGNGLLESCHISKAALGKEAKDYPEKRKFSFAGHYLMYTPWAFHYISNTSPLTFSFGGPWAGP